MNINELKLMVREELIRRLDEQEKKTNQFLGIKPNKLAQHLGLHYGGWGTWLDELGNMVAKTLEGNLIKTNDLDNKI